MRFSLIIRFLFIFLILSFTADGQVTVETLTAPVNASGGIAVNDSGIIHIADFGSGVGAANGTNLFKLQDDGTLLLFATGLNGGSGSAFDSQGNLIQSNIASSSISKITPDGTVSFLASFGIANPVGVAISQGDTIYIANCGSASLARITPNGSAVWVSSNLFSCPNGLAIDDNGILYVGNFNNGRILKVTPDKQVSILATLPGGRTGHLKFFEGALYSGAQCARQFYKVTLEGQITLIAGSGIRGNEDGPGEFATFNHTNGIAVKREGDNIALYVNDALSLSGTCTTVPLHPGVIRKITIGPLNSQEIANADSSIVTVSRTELQANGLDSAIITIIPHNVLGQAPTAGVTAVTLTNTGSGQVSATAIDNGDGTFSATIHSGEVFTEDTITVTVEAGGGEIELSTKTSLIYWGCGDIDGRLNGPDIADLTFLIDHLFINFPPVPIPAAANIDCAGNIDIADLTFLIDHLFINFPPLCCN